MIVAGLVGWRTHKNVLRATLSAMRKRVRNSNISLSFFRFKEEEGDGEERYVCCAHGQAVNGEGGEGGGIVMGGYEEAEECQCEAADVPNQLDAVVTCEVEGLVERCEGKL